MKQVRVTFGPVGRRVAVGMGANALGKVWVALIQLVSIPVLAGAWGADRFGLWLMITTLPTYLALASTGFNTVAGVDIARSYVHQKLQDCQITYQSVWALITSITGSIVLIGILTRLAMALADNTGWELGDWEEGDTAAVMLVYSFLVIQSSMVLAAYRGVSRYAEGTILYDLIGLAEGLAVIAVVGAGGGLLSAASMMIVLRTLGLVGLHLHIAGREPWARIGVRFARASEIRRLLHPSLGALTVAGANALSIQGVAVTLGIAAGPAATAAFVSARTIARLPLQLSDLLGRASMPEMARAWFAPDHRLFWRLTGLNVAFAVAILVPSGMTLLFIGTPLANLVAQGHIAYESGLPAALGLVVLFQGITATLGQSLAAQQRQHSYGYMYLLLASFMATLPLILIGLDTPSTATAMGMACCEAVVLSIMVRQVLIRQKSNNARQIIKK